MKSTYNKLNKQSKQYFKDLYSIRKSFVENDFYDPCVEELTCLVYAFKINTDRVKSDGIDIKGLHTIIDENKQLNGYIIKIIARCKTMLLDYRAGRIGFRHTI